MFFGLEFVQSGFGIIREFVVSLAKGIRLFKERVGKRQKEFYRALAEGQRPEALVITCIDSRVEPLTLMQAELGKVLVLRNAGNLVPPYGEGDGSVASAVEFAVQALGVRDIIVLGHSDCAAVRALRDGLSEDFPRLRGWLAQCPLTKGRRGLREMEQEHILRQLQHLRGYPPVAKAPGLRLHGWYFDIAEAAVLTYNGEVFEEPA